MFSLLDVIEHLDEELTKKENQEQKAIAHPVAPTPAPATAPTTTEPTAPATEPATAPTTTEPTAPATAPTTTDKESGEELL